MPERVTLHSADGTRLAAHHTPGPDGAPAVLVVPGYGSRKENHADYAEALAAAGMGALVLDVRGHGESDGTLDAAVLDDVVAALAWLADRYPGPLGLRGSSMGGYLALHAAPLQPRVRAVVAVCPAQARTLRRRAEFPLPEPLPEVDDVVGAEDGIARGYWHARGDEVVPWQGTFATYQRTARPRRLRVVMGGDHRSLQHDPRVIAETVAFLAAHLGAGA